MKSKNQISTHKVLAGAAWIAALGLATMLFVSSQKVSKKGVIEEVIYTMDHATVGSDLVTIEEIEDRIVEAYEFDLVGAEVADLDLHAIEELLDQEPFITKSHAFVDRKRRLHVNLAQRVPLLRVMDVQGNNYYLDADGVRLPLSHHFTARVPVISGQVPAYVWNDSTHNALRDAHRVVDAMQSDAFLSAWLESIHLDQQGELVLYGNVGRFGVEFGPGKDLERKLSVLKKFMKSGANSLAWNSLESISLKYEGQVITRTKPKA
ncbi:MAG: hypothetical protein KTR24_11295 [Saprospiraceae bacterium]|nr:hypothetical protein [Saprospiraceae bacterium]